MRWDWQAFFGYLTPPYIFQGAVTTLWLAALSLLCGGVVGLLLALAKELNKGPLNFVYSVYTNFFRGTPLLVQLILIYSGLPQFGISFSVLQSAILALGLNEGAYLAEIIRSGISSVPRGQVEAAKAIGMPYLTTMRYVVLPQAFRITIPPIGNEFNGLLKSTSLGFGHFYARASAHHRGIDPTEFPGDGALHRGHHLLPCDDWSLERHSSKNRASSRCVAG